MSTPQIRTLHRALEKLKEKKHLADALGVSLADLEAYLSGEKPLPNKLFLQALDIVADRR